MMLVNTVLLNTYFKPNELSDANRKRIIYIEHILNSQNQGKVNELIEGLLEYSKENLIQFYFNSDLFKDFCANHSVWHQAIANKLKRHGYISIDLKAMDGSFAISLFDIYISVLMLSDYYDNLPYSRTSREARKKCYDAVDIACEIGLFNAFTIRIQLNTKKLYGELGRKTNSGETMMSILEDAKKLSNLYWSPGYAQSGVLLLDVAHTLSSIDSENDRAMLIKEEGIKYLLAGSLIAEQDESKRIQKSLDENEKVIAKDQSRDITTWEEAKLNLFNLAGSNANYESLLSCAKQMVKPLLDKPIFRLSP